MDMSQKTPEQRKQDRKKLRKVALLRLAQVIGEKAEQACERTNAYNNRGAYLQIFRMLRRMAEDLDEMKTLSVDDAPLTAAQQGPGCNSDDDCPDDYICDQGTCMPLFPFD